MLTDCDSLIPISISTLTHKAAPQVDIYLCTGRNEPAILYCSGSTAVNLAEIQRLGAQGVAKLYIHPNDREQYQHFLRENWRDLLMDESQTLLSRASLMSEVIRDVLKEQFATGSTDSIVESCKDFGVCTAEVLGREPVVLKELARVLYHDYGTFTHSANVSAYAVLLGRALGYPSNDLAELAVGGLLHDLGKLEISHHILNKPSKLEEEEVRVIRTHPALGLERLGNRGDLSEGQLMMIYQHHERCNGAGYPVGCSREEIHPWARLCAIVDVFEALTSFRPYRCALSNPTAMTILKRRPSEFDDEMLSCWIQLTSE